MVTDTIFEIKFQEISEERTLYAHITTSCWLMAHPNRVEEDISAEFRSEEAVVPYDQTAPPYLIHEQKAGKALQPLHCPPAEVSQTGLIFYRRRIFTENK